MIKLRSHGELVHSYVVSLLGFGWRDVADRLEEAAVIEPVDPFESGVFHGFEGFPWPAPVDHLGLEQAVDGFGERIVVAVTDTADRRLNPGLGQALRIANGDVLGASVRMMDQLARL